jgi:hypothetical protein
MIPLIQNPKSKIQNSLWLMIAVILIAAFFRFISIDTAPPGWRDDELIEFGMDQRIAQGWRPLFITEAEGHEPVYHYIHAATIALFGENIIGYKWLPFAFGLLTVALTFALAKRMFDARVGLLAATLMAVSFWPIMYSRLGVRHIGLLPWMLAAFYLLYPARSGEQGAGGRGRIFFAGIFLAAGLMTYFAGRAVPIILIGFLIYLLLFKRSILKRVWLPTIAAIAIGAIIVLPMFIQISQTPGSEKRTEVVGGPLIELRKGNLKPAIDTTLGTLGMFTFAGDPESLYNVSGRPVFDWITGTFFYLGVSISLIRLKRIENGFALAWLVIGLAPAFVSLPAGSFSHTIAALPIVFVLTAFGAVSVVSWISDKMTRWQDDKMNSTKKIILSSLHPFILSLIVVIGATLTIRDYFGTWAHDDFVRFQYHAPTREIAKWLDQNPDVVDVAIGTNPNELYLDPVALKLDLTREDVKARWFNPDRALVLPADGVIIVSPMQTAGDYINMILVWSRIEPSTLCTRGVCIFSANHLLQLYNIQPSLATFGGLISLIPYIGPWPDSWSKIIVNSGSAISVNMLWRIDMPNHSLQLKSFFHVLNSHNEVVDGEDREDINTTNLIKGDLLLQTSKIVLPSNLEPGSYPIEIGWYNPDTGERLKLADGSDHYLLNSIEVTAP